MRGFFAVFAICAWLSFVRTAQATPELRAELGWQGSCDDTEDLVRQVRARGAELELREASLPPEEAAHAVRVDVSVQSVAPSALVAEIQLQSEAGKDSRRVQASACGDLRSAVAWVLVVLAQQRVAEQGPPSASPGEQSAPSAIGTFPVAALEPSPPPNQLAPAATVSPEPQSPPARNRHSSAVRSSSWGLGFSFAAAFGFVPAPSLGPMLFGRYRSDVRWLPELQLSVLRLVTIGYEPNGTSLSLSRDAARLGAWVPLVGKLELGFAAEAGRLLATGSGSTLERGSSDSTFWFAFGVPLRVAIPLLGRHLQAELQAELDYAPVPYTFRYGSGDTLTSTSAFEGRGQVGLVSLF